MTPAKATGTPKSYAAALEELEAILAELENDDLDIDILSTQVERAAILLAHCRGRLDAARVEVERVVARIDDGPSTP